MFACRAYDVLGLTRFVQIDRKLAAGGLDCVSRHNLRLYGTETDGPVGMAHVTITANGNVRVHVVMDFSIPERLQVEIGELGIEVYYTYDVTKEDIGVGRAYDKFSRIYISNIQATRAELRQIGADTKVDGDYAIRKLTPVEWSWDF